MTAIVDVRDLTRHFTVRRKESGRLLRRRSEVVAVDAMTFSVQPGESVGYIGANGAGKSTTIKMLTGILVPTSGHVRTCGLEPLKQRKRLARQVGVVFGQRTQLWWDLPVSESFQILAAIHRLEAPAAARRIDDLVDKLEMGSYLGSPVRQLSLGQRMRAEIAASLLHAPDLLILDEPTIGLDVLSKQRLREFLRAERREKGITLLLTTHDVGDVERLCDRVLLVDHGRLAFDGTLTGLAATVGARRELVLDLAGPCPDLIAIPGSTHVGSEANGMRQRLSFDAAKTTVVALLGEVSRHAEVLDVTVAEPDIEDVLSRIYASTR
jgi:ABC-2 type transport system ATP-binding protein